MTGHFVPLVALTAVLAGQILLGRAEFHWNIPAPFPRPSVPVDNPMSSDKVELGRRLFYDKRMSLNGKQSCASCHRQELAFTDGRPRAEGTTGEIHPRGSMTAGATSYPAPNTGLGSGFRSAPTLPW